MKIALATMHTSLLDNDVTAAAQRGLYLHFFFVMSSTLNNTRLQRNKKRTPAPLNIGRLGRHNICRKLNSASRSFPFSSSSWCTYAMYAGRKEERSEDFFLFLSKIYSGLGKVVNLLHLGQHGLEINLEVLEQAVVEAKDPAVDNGVLVPGVALLDSGRLDNVAALFLDVELDEAIVAGVVVVGGGKGVELLLVQPVDVADVTQPRVQEAEVARGHGGLDAAAAVVAADDDVLDAEVAHGVVDDAHDVEVRVADEVGDVAVDEGLAGLEAGDLLGGDARVGAADPEVLGALAGRELGEVAWVGRGFGGGPGAVVVEEPVVGLGEVFGELGGGGGVGRGGHVEGREVG